MPTTTLAVGMDMATSDTDGLGWYFRTAAFFAGWKFRLPSKWMAFIAADFPLL